MLSGTEGSRAGYCPGAGPFARKVGECFPRRWMPHPDPIYAEAARAIRGAAALVVATGAGMGIDSGLPDFRGDQGFWKAYPAYERSASPSWTRPTPIASRRIRPSAGASTATGSTSTGTPFPTTATGSCSTGWSGSRFPDSPSPPTWTASSRRRAGIRSGSTRSTGPSITSSARRPATTRSGSAGKTCRWTSPPCGRRGSPPAAAAGAWPAPTSSCSATGPGCPIAPPSRAGASRPFSTSTASDGWSCSRSAPGRRWPPSAGSPIGWAACPARS